MHMAALYHVVPFSHSPQLRGVGTSVCEVVMPHMKTVGARPPSVYWHVREVELVL